MRWRLPGVLLTASICAAAACSHPIPFASSHVEAADLVLGDSAGLQLTRTVDNRSWSLGSLTVVDGRDTYLTITLLDFQQQPIDLADRRDVELRLEAENESLLQWEPLTGRGILRPFGTGTTRVRFLVWHVTHADFVTPWLEVHVEAPRQLTATRTVIKEQTK